MKPLAINKLHRLSWMLLWFMLPISMRATAVALWVFGFFTLVSLIQQRPVIRKHQLILTGLFILFLAMHIISSWSETGQAGWIKYLERKTVFVVIPLLMLVANSTLLEKEKWAIRGFLSSLLVLSIYLLFGAIVSSFSGWDNSFWTYHGFAGKNYLGAIYLSWYISAALIYLAFRHLEPDLQRFRYPLILFFTLILLLASSKLFILFTVPVLVWKLFVSKFDSKRKTLSFVLLLVLIASLSKPFINRLDELRNTELDIIGQKEYAYDTPFNGITLRLVLWGFGSEILSENNAWLKGTGIQSKQELLNRKIEESGMYTGNPEFGDRGYLDYNFHNQYVETLVGTGIVGLVILLFLILDIFAGVRYKLIFPLPVYILTAMFFLTESVLERQAGIVFFCLIACTYLLTNTLESQSVGSRSE